MKRKNNLYQRIYDINNLIEADRIAQKGKSKQYGVIAHEKYKSENIELLHQLLRDQTYITSKYDTFTIHEPKERLVFRLPYFPDRICHHAVMLILEPIFIDTFTADTYSCIKGKGIHKASSNLKIALRNKAETKYCLKLDIRKFYPSVDHEILKSLLRKKFKDSDLLWLLDSIIDSAPGLPIGNYLSQYFANFYLAFFDHWIKENKQIKFYFRYADDLVILSDSKPSLHQLLSEIRTYLKDNLKLEVKGSYQVFPVESRSIDFVGYRHYHTHTLLRKSIKQNFARMLSKRKNKASIASYKGWAKHCNSTNLLNKLLQNEKL